MPTPEKNIAASAAVESKSTSGVFVSTIAAMHSGKVLEDLDDAIREVTRAVQVSQLKGELTLKLSIVPNGIGAGDTPLFKVDDTIKVRLPKKARIASVFFADDDSNLTRRNTRQEEMKLVAMEGGKGLVAMPTSTPAVAAAK